MADRLADIAAALVSHCRNGTESEALDTLYAPHAVSAEAMDMPGTPAGREVVGIDAIKAKHAWWASVMEMHSASTSDPFQHGEDRFAVIFELDATNRETGERSQMKEVAVYHVADGKIVREEFFYSV